MTVQDAAASATRAAIMTDPNLVIMIVDKKLRTFELKFDVRREIQKWPSSMAFIQTRAVHTLIGRILRRASHSRPGRRLISQRSCISLYFTSRHEHTHTLAVVAGRRDCTKAPYFKSWDHMIVASMQEAETSFGH